MQSPTLNSTTQGTISSLRNPAGMASLPTLRFSTRNCTASADTTTRMVCPVRTPSPALVTPPAKIIPLSPFLSCDQQQIQYCVFQGMASCRAMADFLMTPTRKLPSLMDLGRTSKQLLPRKSNSEVMGRLFQSQMRFSKSPREGEKQLRERGLWGSRWRGCGRGRSGGGSAGSAGSGLAFSEGQQLPINQSLQPP